MLSILEHLFGSKAKVRLMRFFLLNSEKDFEVDEIVTRNKLDTREVIRLINQFQKFNFVVEKKKGAKKTYAMNVDFDFYPELKSLMVKSTDYSDYKNLSKIKSIGKVKLVLISGIFLNYPKSKADIVIVADNIKRKRLNNVISALESEISKEVRYVIMGSDEFKYRLNMTDRFLIRIFEDPHKEIVNAIPDLKQTVRKMLK